MALNSDPNSETMELSYRSEFRVRVGMPIPIKRGEGAWVTLGGAVDLHDPSANLFPATYWRGILRLSVEFPVRDFRLGAHFFHESDHESVNHLGLYEFRETPFLYLNALGIHVFRRWEMDRIYVDLRGAIRFHGHTCTVRRIFISDEDLQNNGCGKGSLARYLGAETQIGASLAGTFGEYSSLFVSLFGETILGGEQVTTEVRFSGRVGAAFSTSHGDWTLFGETRLGNAVGLHRRERRYTVGFGLRYTPPFAD